MKNFFRRALSALRRGQGALRGRRWHIAFCSLCALVIVLAGAYALHWVFNRNRIEADSRLYQSMYSPAPVETPGASPASAATHSPKPRIAAQTEPSPVRASPPPSPSAPAISPSITPMVSPSSAPATAAAPERTMEAPTAEPTLAPLATPDEDTLILSLPTAPGTQESFSELLLYNPETVGFLTIGDTLALPVVQRLNDNEYYLDHNFSGEQSSEGALFLDGANRLLPGDMNLIVYGHNMKNGSMFGKLWSFEDLNFLRQNAVIRFDTIYENGLYVPFAMFGASMKPGDAHYFDVRQVAFDETSFELFALKLKTRSTHAIPVEVEYGDQLLMLVTCSYSDADGRYIVALRKLRPGETEEQMLDLVAQAK